jgi:hypothetical protein
MTLSNKLPIALSALLVATMAQAGGHKLTRLCGNPRPC